MTIEYSQDRNTEDNLRNRLIIYSDCIPALIINLPEQ